MPSPTRPTALLACSLLANLACGGPPAPPVAVVAVTRVEFGGSDCGASFGQAIELRNDGESGLHWSASGDGVFATTSSSGTVAAHSASSLVVAAAIPETAMLLSPSDTEEKLTFREKLRRYAALGTPELVSFRADGKPGRRLRAWDRTKGQLVERIVSQERTPCRAIGGFFVVHEEPEIGPALRLVDAKGKLVLTEAGPAQNSEQEHRKRRSCVHESAALVP